MNAPSRILPAASTWRHEAIAISEWWARNTPDFLSGGFVGQVDADGTPCPFADKGSVLNARLLWFFSAVANRFQDRLAQSLADRAYDYIAANFVDGLNGGVFWSLDHKGHPRERRKQAYAQAFVLYGLAEYFALTKNNCALELAKSLQIELEGRFWDADKGGYIEALSEAWRPIDDLRLSDKDRNAPKTMNTHLHVLEAYSGLHVVAPDQQTFDALYRATLVFLDRFATCDGHLRLFFDMKWNDLTEARSFGHEIEASWLIWEAVEVLQDADLIARARPIVIKLAENTLKKAVLVHGGIAYEEHHSGHLDPNGEWWGQAEGLVGFVNAWQMTDDAAYLLAANRLWHRILSSYGAGKGQEWTWYAADSNKISQPLVSQWKCPYHNGRAMIELDRRLAGAQAKTDF